MIIAGLMLIGIYSYGQKDSVSAADYKAARTDKKDKGQVSYEQSMSKADMAFAGKDYLVAKRFYKLALIAKPSEAYPQSQVDVCDKKMASDSWMATDLNCPCNKGKEAPLKNFSDIYTITSDDSIAHAVLPGSVASFTRDSVAGITTIIIKHGKYMATYSNLKNTSVKLGDDVKEGQAIGVVRKQGADYVLNFSLWHGKEKEDAIKNIHCK
jgi:hypothetical protein